jgi:molecular chaperone GrpE
LDSVDNLERAIQAAGDEQTPVLEGVKLTLKSLLTTLEKFGGAADTQNGQCRSSPSSWYRSKCQANQIGTVLQKGYTLNGRLLRPAMVMVGQ